MIHILAREPRSAMGVAAILGVDGVPCDFVDHVEDARDGLLVVPGPVLLPHEVEPVLARPSVVLIGGAHHAEVVLGDGGGRAVVEPCEITVAGETWSERARLVAGAAAVDELALPPVPVWAGEGRPEGHLADAIVGGEGERRTVPAVVVRGSSVWSAVDLGAAFASLMTEDYFPRGARPRPASGARRAAESVYYMAPDAVRRFVQRRVYSRLEERLRDPALPSSSYPCDATGALLIEWFRRLLVRASGRVFALERWPAPYVSAAAITHDLEPCAFAYAKGLDDLLETSRGTGHAPTLGVVAESAPLIDDTRRKAVARVDVLCHGLTHRGERVDGRPDVLTDVRRARETLEAALGREVRGYRSPRLDRSSDLAWALDRVGFEYDSSFPDVDRENMAHFGGGVRLNVPFRPLIREDSGALRPSQCLELPMTAPDCIQPLFGGASWDQLVATVARKAAFVRAARGVHVGLVHGGVFGPADSRRRMRLLEALVAEVRRDDVWLASIGEVASWWTDREQVRVVEDSEGLRVVNRAERRLTGLRLVVEEWNQRHVIDLPPVAAGDETRLTSREIDRRCAA